MPSAAVLEHFYNFKNNNDLHPASVQPGAGRSRESVHCAGHVCPFIHNPASSGRATQPQPFPTRDAQRTTRVRRGVRHAQRTSPLPSDATTGDPVVADVDHFPEAPPTFDGARS